VTNLAIAELIFLLLLSGTLIAVWLIVGLFCKLGEMDMQLRMLTFGHDWGQVRLDLFAIRAGVHVAIANWYLARKARQFNGLREVDDLGDVVFLFGEAKRKFLQEHLQ